MILSQNSLKLSLLSGAYKNAGDFLIEESCISLIRNIFPDVTIKKFYRNTISENWDKINDADAVLFCGGPIYMPHIENHLPHLTQSPHGGTFIPPVMIIGGGSYFSGHTRESSYTLSDLSRQFLFSVDKSLGLGCRDWLTLNMLKKQGFNNLAMTGCAAWYYLPIIENTDFARDISAIKSIMVSNPASAHNHRHALRLIEYLKNTFTSSTIKLIFHRGIDWQDDYVDVLRRMDVEYIDISGCNGMDVYDGVDLHIGFRVHAHLYSLSRRERSILIEEDSRGLGANAALGLPSITAFPPPRITMLKRIYDRLRGRTWYGNEKMIGERMLREIDAYINDLTANAWMQIRHAFSVQKETYRSMHRFISQLKKI